MSRTEMANEPPVGRNGAASSAGGKRMADLASGAAERRAASFERLRATKCFREYAHESEGRSGPVEKI